MSHFDKFLGQSDVRPAPAADYEARSILQELINEHEALQKKVQKLDDRLAQRGLWLEHDKFIVDVAIKLIQNSDEGSEREAKGIRVLEEILDDAFPGVAATDSNQDLAVEERAESASSRSLSSQDSSSGAILEAHGLEAENGRGSGPEDPPEG